MIPERKTEEQAKNSQYMKNATVQKGLAMNLRDEFDEQVRSAIKRCYELGYKPSRFMQMIEEAHPVEVAKRLVVSGEFQHGIQELTKLGHQELTIEGIMKLEQFSTLFTPAELEAAAWRLANVPTK